jgi:hypothetical protein
MRGITSKIIEFNQHLQQNKTDIFGVVESFLSSDDKPPRLDKSYRWVGKCRKNGLKKGGEFYNLACNTSHIQKIVYSVSYRRRFRFTTSLMLSLFIRSITLWTFRSGAAY